LVLQIDSHSLAVGPGRFDLSHPLLFWYGAAAPAANAPLFEACCARLAGAMHRRMAIDPLVATSGAIINTSGGVDGASYGSLLAAVKALGADVVLVVGHDRLYQQLRAALNPDPLPGHAAAAAVTVVKVPRSGGVAVRDGPARSLLQGQRVRDYFYGAPDHADDATAVSAAPSLKPHLAEVPLDRLRLWRWACDDGGGSGGLVPVTGAVAAKKAAARFRGRLERAETTTALRHVLAAVLHEPPPWEATEAADALGDSGDDDETADAAGAYRLVGCNAAGFVVIQSLDAEKGTLTLLCPCPGKLPSSDLVLASGIKWTE